MRSDFADLESTKEALAMKMVDSYQPEPIYHPGLPLDHQYTLMFPKAGAAESDFPSNEYHRMISSVTQLRKDYVRTKQLADRKQIASEELAAWTQYIEERKHALKQEDLCDEHWISDTSLKILKDSFDR